MNDREIYEEIGKILFACSPKPEEKNHISARVWPKQSVDMGAWFGEYLSGETSYGLPAKAVIELKDLFYALSDYFDQNSMGQWNVAHYVLDENGSSFNIDFEFNKDLHEGTLDLYQYRQKFKEPSQLNTKSAGKSGQLITWLKDLTKGKRK